MSIRTDMAVEFTADKVNGDLNIVVKKYEVGEITVSNVEILDEKAAKKIGKPIGKYVTLETKRGINIFDIDNVKELIIAELRGLVGRLHGNILVVGIGNKTVTPDALGPKAAEKIMATRHISSTLAESLGLDNLIPVSVLSPGVLGQTGIETKEIIEGAVERVKPEVIIIVDAFAAREVSRLGRTVQLSNTGLAPGSGVGNSRAAITEETLGVKCVTVGVPTVVDAATLTFDLTGKTTNEHEPLIVTPRDIDRLIERASQQIAQSINIALQPDVDPEVLISCV